MTNFWQKLPKPFTVLAPMDDVTDNVFRKVINETARPDVFFTEFASADGLISKGGTIVNRKLIFESDQHPIVAQIWGNDPEIIYKAAKIVKEKGFDGIDINMGCPIREVMKRNAGAGLIGNYELSKSIIEALKKGAGGIPVSVKTRLGKNVNIAEDWATFLLEQNLSALTIHARTAKQMSKGLADWNEIAKIVKIRDRISPETLIIGNGDVKSYAEIVDKTISYGVDGVMVGRGIFGNPWIFAKNKRISELANKDNYINLFLRHLDYYEKENPETKLMIKRYPSLKKFLKMYINKFNGANALRLRLMETQNPQEARELLKI